MTIGNENVPSYLDPSILLNDDNYLQDLEDSLNGLIVLSIDAFLLLGTKDYRQIKFDSIGVERNMKDIHITLSDLQHDFFTAITTDGQAKKIENLGNYYGTQYGLLDALNNLYKEGLNTNSHDKHILHTLHRNFLKKWKTIAENVDVTEKNKQMSDFIQEMLATCQQASGKVTGKTSGALIKNVVLILSALLTLGISLGIYAAATQQSRAEGRDFFFKNTDSKSKITDLEQNLKDVNTEMTKVQP